MAVDTKPKREDQIDQRANEMFNSHPDLQGAEKSAGEDPYANSGIDQAQAYANDPKNSSEKLADSEKESGRQGFWKPDSDSKSQGFSFRGLAKKGGPAGGIVAAILGGVFGLGVLVSPSLAVIHLKEVLTGDLSDAVAAMDTRSTRLLKTKLKDLGKSGPSSCTLKIRCGLRGMSDKQIKNFEKAGIKVEPAGEKNSLTRKTPVGRLIFTDSAGNEAPIKNIGELNKKLGDPNIRSQLRRAYNPKFYSLADKVGLKVLTEKLHTSRAKKLTSNDPKKLDEDITKATAGEKVDATIEAGKNTDEDTEDTKKKTTAANAEADEFTKGLAEVGDTDSVFKSTAKGFATGVAKGVMVTGTLDTACSVYGGMRAIGALAKTKRSIQLAQFAMVAYNFADSVKAGDATPEQASYIGDKLAAVDMREKIQNEDSKISDKGMSEVPNPDYGKSAYDAQAVKAGMYNDAPNLNSRSQQFMVAGGFTGTLIGVNEKIASLLGGGSPKSISDKCKKIQNPFVRLGSAAVGIALAAGSFGASTAISITLSTAVSMSMPLIQSYLGNIVAGKTVTSKTKGVDAGNAIFSGTGVIQGSIAQARGMKPASKASLKQYLAYSKSIKEEYIAMETEDDRKDPFNIYKQYSFAGQLARSLLPATQYGNSSVALLKPLGLLQLSALSITPKSYAAEEFNPERFSKCKDDVYKELKIDADIMCNVRYSMSPEELNMDPEKVVDDMLNGGYIDDEGIPKGEYEEWLKNCANRTAGWGESTESDGTGDKSSDCLEETPRNRLFRVHTMDRSVEDGMDNGPASEDGASDSTNTPTEGATSFTVASYNVFHKQWGHQPAERAKTTADYIKSKSMDIVGMQEVSPVQFNMITSNLPGYEGFPNTTMRPQAPGDKDRSRPAGIGGIPDNHGTSIIWNTAKYKKINSGWLGGMVNNVGAGWNFGWVELKDVSDRSVFVLNIHSPTNHNGGTMAKRRQNAKAALEWAKQHATGTNIVLIVGDMNRSGPDDYDPRTNNAAGYCVLTSGGIMQHTHDLQKGLPTTKACPSGAKDAPLDQVYVSTNAGVTASGWNWEGKEKGNVDETGTDHGPMYVTLSTPGGSTSSSTTTDGSLSLPLDAKFWKSDRTDFLEAHGMSSGTFTSPYVKGLASDISNPPDGSPVYAMMGGKVTSFDGCSTIISSSVGGGELQIAYGHMSNQTARQNTIVKAGDKIGVIGYGKVCNSSGGHLHIDMALDGKHICPQDVFLAIEKGQTPDFNTLTSKAKAPCGRV